MRFTVTHAMNYSHAIEMLLQSIVEKKRDED